MLRLSNEDRVAVKRAFEHEAARLASSLYVYDFFSDPTRLLASPYPPDSVDLMRADSGEAILPGKPRAILALGTRVRVEAIEFPSPLTARRRPRGTPREAIWITFTCLERDGCAVDSGQRQLVAVVAAELSARSELESRLAQFFSFGDPVADLAHYGDSERAALIEKRICPGMSPSAVALAWGRPEAIRVEWQGDVRVETWRWPLGRRTAVFRGAGLAETMPRLEGLEEREAQRAHF